jgi:outer membrane protein assembly factor BamB
LAGGCETEGEKASETGPAGEEAEQKEELGATEWRAPEPIDLLEPPEEKRRELTLSEAEKYPPCRDLLEPDGEPRETFLPEVDNRALTMAGCDPEAYRVHQGRHFVAYGLPHGGSEARDLRFVAYDADGELIWSHRMDRSQYTDNFNANFRQSFIALPLPQLACVGTLWEGGTQASCLEEKSGKPRWAGELKFWSGIPLQAQETSLIGADISGMTRRYPYSGVEMRRVDFDQLGGHSALYITDGTRLVFAPKMGKPQRLTAYDFETFKPSWRIELPGHPDPGYNSGAVPEHGLVVIKIGNELYGIDVEEGRVRWSLTVGEDRPPLAASAERLHLLLRREKRSNLLYALKPDSGEVDWYGPVPTGTLQLSWVDGAPLLRSIHAIQQVTNAD